MKTEVTTERTSFIPAGYPAMKVNMKDMTFGPEHVGVKVTDIISGETGIITKMESGCNYPVLASFNKSYTSCGKLTLRDKTRRLVIGHNPTVTITEDEVPKVCGVCGVEHESDQSSTGFYFVKFTKAICPLRLAKFNCKASAEDAIKKMTELKL